MQPILSHFLPEIEKLSALKPDNQKLYLVGGVIRDFLIGRKNRDIDVLCDFDTKMIARKFAERVSGSFFVLDEERNISRVIEQTQKGKKIYDFARVRGESLSEDLSGRDFTINAMAIDLDSPDKIIDPLSGRQDLDKKILRDCSESSFTSDPVRVIRGVRYCLSHGLTLDPGTHDRLKKCVPMLKCVSGERKRDEFIKILEAPHPEMGIELLWQLGILTQIGFSQEIDIKTIKEKVAILATLLLMFDPSRPSNNVMNNDDLNIAARFGKFEKQIFDHFNYRNLSDRSERQLILLAEILRNTKPQEINEIISRLLLSKEESEKLKGILSSQFSIIERFSENLLSDREMYLYLKSTNSICIDLVFSALKELSSSENGEITHKKRETILQQCENLLTCWFTRPDVVNPQVFLDGNDLMFQFDLTPGHLIGELLAKLREEQAAGTIKDKNQALAWVENQLGNQIVRNSWEL